MIDDIDRHAFQDGNLTEADSHLSGAQQASESLLGKKRKRSVEDTLTALNHDDVDSTTTSHGNQTTVLDQERVEIAKRRALRAQIQAKYSRHGSPTPLLATTLPNPLAGSPAATPVQASTIHDIDPDEVFELTKTSSSAPATNYVDPRQGEPSAADYDPDIDRIQELASHRKEVEILNHKPPDRAISEDEEDDMFADPRESTNDPRLLNAAFTGIAGAKSALSQAKKLDESMLDSWADTEGYYRIMIGELLDDRYAVESILGKGVFSAVVRCVDQKSGEGVAIKVIRNNDVMRKAGLKEIEILEKLMAADPDDRRHVVRLRRTFEHRNHLCLVFESLSLNLREILKKFGRDVGLNIRAVRAYAQQMFMALTLMRKCDIMHADLKPDNILISESRTLLKICDLGSASDISENAPTPYLASRFYRAPEVILGLPYDTAMDTWAIGCTLYELYTGKILFPGRTNNQMLRLFMECRGRFPLKLLKKALFAASHFDDQYNFNSNEVDHVTGETTVRVMNIVKATRDYKSQLMPGTDPNDRQLIQHFIDLLERCTDLDPGKRILPNDALKHPFIART